MILNSATSNWPRQCSFEWGQYLIYRLLGLGRYTVAGGHVGTLVSSRTTLAYARWNDSECRLVTGSTPLPAAASSFIARSCCSRASFLSSTPVNCAPHSAFLPAHS